MRSIFDRCLSSSDGPRVQDLYPMVLVHIGRDNRDACAGVTPCQPSFCQPLSIKKQAVTGNGGRRPATMDSRPSPVRLVRGHWAPPPRSGAAHLNNMTMKCFVPAHARRGRNGEARWIPRLWSCQGTRLRPRWSGTTTRQFVGVCRPRALTVHPQNSTLFRAHLRATTTANLMGRWRFSGVSD